MTVALKITDASSSGETILETLLQFPAEVISALQLIEARVQAEVERYNASDRTRFMGLVQPTGSERELNGFRLRKKRKVDPDTQRQVAIDAFLNNGFFLLVNDRQITELDDPIFITPGTSVVFLKLTPLVGG